MNISEILSHDILPNVMKPSRYLGTELNAVHKNPAEVDVRMGLAFPDLYDLGLGNLGLSILYDILNRLPWCWAERAYAPAPDMAEALRARDVPLFAWESKTPLKELDVLGFSMQSELTYTSILYMLDLAGIPLMGEDRGDNDPIVFAGGPCAYNPEPLAPFVDCFLIGDGEEAVIELAECARRVNGAPREEQLRAYAELSGVYVPVLYPFETLPDGRVLPAADGPKIVRRVVENLDKTPYPAEGIVPFTQLVHDRAAIEVMRGCTRGCRFCFAGATNRPVRERRPETVDALMEETLRSTGYEEVSLVSLSTCDHSAIRSLLAHSAQRAHPDSVSVSLPSLRLDSFSVKLADAISDVRRSGLTFAPEAATDRMRQVINKDVDEETLLDICREVYERGWRHVKLYFMIGLPTETDEDVEAIADLCLRVLDRGRQVTRKAQLHTGISTFVPKPFTPFQWAPQIDMEETLRRHGLLKKCFGKRDGLRFGRHAPEASFVEGLIARSDRRAAQLIHHAYQNGARLDSSSEYLDLEAWQAAIESSGFDVDAALGAREMGGRLPWDHIDSMVRREWLEIEWQRAQALELTSDCRTGRCSQCGLNVHVPEACSKAQHSGEDASELAPLEERNEPPAAQRIRFRIGREGEARFLSHLEMANTWGRVLRRTGAALSFSQGFHAHPKITFSTALPVGMESEGDFMDVVLRERTEPAGLFERVRATLPPGLRVFEAEEVPLGAPSLMSDVCGFDYTLFTHGQAAQIASRAKALMAQASVMVERKGRPTGRRKSNKVKHVDVRPAITRLDVLGMTGEEVAIDLSVQDADGVLAKPREVVALLELDPAQTGILRRRTHLRT